MKIAVDVAQTCGERAGMGWHADAIARALVKQVGPASVMLYHHFGDWINPTTRTGSRIEGVEQPFMDMPHPKAAALWQAIQAGTCPLPLAPDIVQSTSFMAPRTPGAKLVYTIHDLCFWTHPEFTSETNRVLCQRQVLAALQYADAFHFISQSSRRDFEAILPGYLERSAKPHLIVPSGSRLTPKARERASPGLPDRQAPWLFVGTIEPRKNVDALLDAYLSYGQRSQAKPRPLVLAGGQGWESAATHQRIAQLQQEHDIQYLGYVDEAKLSELYQNAFALLCPSHYEGFGLPVIEAMSVGLPCLANPVPAIVEFAAGCAKWVDFGDRAMVADTMIELEADELRYKHLEIAGHEKAAEFTWQRTAASLVAFYQQILDT